MEEAGIVEKDELKSSQESPTDERIQRFRDSASTLNPGSSTGGVSVTHSYELQTVEGVAGVTSGTSLSATVMGVATPEEGNSQQVGGARDLLLCWARERTYDPVVTMRNFHMNIAHVHIRGCYFWINGRHIDTTCTCLHSLLFPYGCFHCSKERSILIGLLTELNLQLQCMVLVAVLFLELNCCVLPRAVSYVKSWSVHTLAGCVCTSSP